MLKIADIPEDVREVLAFPFDFGVEEVPDDPLWFTTAPAIDLLPIAGEGTGGSYAELVGSGKILFVDSEGSGGIIADSLTDLLQLIVTHPYWRDLLKFSGNGSLAEMERSVNWAAREYADCFPDAPGALRLIQTSLNIMPSAESLKRLHQAVTTSARTIRLFGPDGSELGSLFNRFTAPA